LNNRIIFEDKHCIIYNKPSNLLVHHSYYARNIEEVSLIQMLKEEGFPEIHPVHRLDRKTSGLIILSKDKTNIPMFQNLFTETKVKKTYIALVRGHVAEQGIIDTPVKNERGNYKEALSHFSCIKHITLNIPVKPYNESRYSYIELEPKTGRMHQLRIHANKISHPIIGDPKHGNRHHNHMFIEKFNISNLFLHASQLEFDHPITGETLKLTAPLPDFWNHFENQIQKHLL
jgi:tRNA pseudouridine65 synthase